MTDLIGGFNWGDEAAGPIVPLTGAPSALSTPLGDPVASKVTFDDTKEFLPNKLQDADDDKLPPKEESYDPETGIRTVVTYARDPATDRLVRTTYRFVKKKKTQRVNKEAFRRRKLRKFGDVADVPPGVELNVSYPDRNEFRLDLSGKKSVEKSEVDVMLDQINKMKDKPAVKAPTIGKGFLFKQTAFVRKELEAKTDEPSAGGAGPSTPSGAPGKFVPAALRSRGERGGYDDGPTIRISNLSEEASDNDLYDLVKSFGNPIRIHLARSHDTGLSKGYAFVTFTRAEDAERAIAKLNGHGYDNLILSVEWSKSMSQFKKEKESKF